MRIGLSELLVILVLLVALFRPDKLPDYAKTFGTFLKKAKESMAQLNEAVEPVKDMVEPVQSLKQEIDGQINEIKNGPKNVTTEIRNE